MNNAYNNTTSAQSYQAFLNSADGKIFQKIIFESILARLDKNQDVQVLDAACGNGWLAKKLADEGFKVQGCDASEPLITSAKQKFPGVGFQAINLESKLPYTDGSLDAVVLSMALHDLQNQKAALSNLNKILKPKGKVIATIVNPYYGFPVGVWKRGLINFILRKQPLLKLAKAYNLLTKDDKNFSWKHNLNSNFTPLSAHINNILATRYKITYLQDIKSNEDSNSFNLAYQLHRFPVILLLEFEKVS